MKLKDGVNIGENGFIFNPTTGESFNVNGIAIRILQHIQADKTEIEIAAEIEKEFDVDQFTIEKHLHEFSNMLYQFGLLA